MEPACIHTLHIKASLTVQFSEVEIIKKAGQKCISSELLTRLHFLCYKNYDSPLSRALSPVNTNLHLSGIKVKRAFIKISTNMPGLW